MVFLLSCASRESQMNDIVSIYNSIDLGQNDSYVKGISAVKNSNDELTIQLSMDVEMNSTNEQIYAALFPTVMSEMVFSINAAKKLVNDGVSINCVIVDSNGGEIMRKKYDKVYLQKDGNAPQGLLDDMDIYKMANLINGSLPVVDTINNITTLKLEIINDNEAQFIYLVPNETLDIFDEVEGIDELMKLEYLSIPKQKNALSEFFNLGLKIFYLNYSNEDRTRSKRIEFTRNDLL